MAGAGNYPDRLQRLVRSTTKDPTNGQEEETFTPGSFYWCRIEPTNGRKQRQYGAEQTGADVTIYVRNYPDLSALDRLYSTEWDETYILDNIRRGDNELIADGFIFDALTV